MRLFSQAAILSAFLVGNAMAQTNVVQQGCMYQPPPSPQLCSDSFLTYFSGQSVGAWTVTQNNIDIYAPEDGTGNCGSVYYYAGSLCACGGAADLNGSDQDPYNGGLTQTTTSLAGHNYQLTFDVSVL